MGLCVLSLCLYGQADTSQVLDTLRIRQNAYPSVSAPRPMQLITSDQLETSQAGNVAEAIRHMRGVQLRDYGGIGGMKTLDVRSMGAHHTGVVYNGMPVQDTQNGLVDLSQYSLYNLQTIRLYNGQPWDLSLPAQAFASAATLVLDPKMPEKSTKAGISARLQSGSFGLFNPALDWDTRVSRNTGLRLSSEWKRWDGEYPYLQRLGSQRDTILDRTNSDMQAFRLEALLQDVADSQSNWSINGYAYIAERGLPGASVINHYSRADRQWDQLFFLQGKLRAYQSERYSLYVYGKYRYQTQRYLDPEASTSLGYVDNRYYQKGYDFSAVQVYKWHTYGKAALAADYAYQTLDASLHNFAYPRRHTLRLNLSGNWEKGSWRLQGNIMGSFWKETSRYQPDYDQKPILTPSISASVRPWSREKLYFRAFYKSIFRMPTFNDRYYTFVGSIDLKPEYTRQWNIGADWESSWGGNLQLHTAVDLYYNRIKDRITAIPTSNIYRWTMVNLGRVGIKGMDLEIGVQGKLPLETDWSAGVRYTWQDARDITPDSYFKDSQVPYAPAHSGSGTVHISRKGWDLDYTLDYTGYRYSQRWNAIENRMDAWILQDVALSYRTQLYTLPIRISTSVQNLGNTRYAIIRNFPMPGRNFRIQLHIKL